MESDQKEKENNGQDYWELIKNSTVKFLRRLNNKRKKIPYIKQLNFSSTEIVGFVVVFAAILSIFIVHRPASVENVQDVSQQSLPNVALNQTVTSTIATVAAGSEEVDIASVSVLTGNQINPGTGKTVSLNNQKIISIYAEINNLSKGYLVYSSDYFTLVADGASYKSTGIGNQPEFLTAMLHPYQSWTGYLNYEVPSSASQFTLVVTSPDQSLKQYNIPIKVQ